jgi:hypothetical protein
MCVHSWHVRLRLDHVKSQCSMYCSQSTEEKRRTSSRLHILAVKYTQHIPRGRDPTKARPASLWYHRKTMLQWKMFSSCSRCEPVLQRSEWLLEPSNWILEELGTGGNGQVYKATCVETGCEHAAKFLSYDGGKHECAMLARAHRSQSRHVVRTICAGLSQNTTGLPDKSARARFVILSELMSEDLFSAVFEPCWLSKSLFAKGCALKHIAYQLLQSISGK